MTRTLVSAETRRRRRIRSPGASPLAGCFLAALLLPAVTHAAAPDAPSPGPPQPRTRYEFINIADNTGPLSAFIFSYPAINNHGTVVFDAGLDDHSRGVFTGNGGPLTTLIHSRAGGPVESADELLSINDAGVVAGRGVLGPEQVGIFTASPSGDVRVLATGFPRVLSGRLPPPRQQYPVLDSDATINQAGAVAFHMWNTGGGAEIMLARDGNVETVVDTRGPLANLGRPVMNDAGAIAFGAIPDSGSPGVYVAENGTLRRVEQPSGFRYGDRLDMNDHGEIVVGGSINNAGTVARHWEFSGADTGIFTGPDLVEDKVVRWGDPMFGSQVRGLAFVGGRGGINDRGDVVFKYNLADGREGIAVARVVPEPAAVALLALAVPMVLRRRSG
jgi:hypothetical protein